MMYPRLFLSRSLLDKNGVIFISIGQDEVGNLLSLGCEIFGEENLITICSRVMKRGGQKGLHFSPCVDYILVFARDINSIEGFREEIGQNIIDKVYTKTEVSGSKKGEKYRSMGLYQAMLDKRANQRFYIKCPDGSLVIPPGYSFPTLAEEGFQVSPNDGDGVWRWTYKRLKEELELNNVEFIESDRTSLVNPDGQKAKWNVYYKIWLKDRIEDGQLPGNILEKFESRHSSAELKLLNIPFDFAKPTELIKFLMTTCGVKERDIILDFFAGSGTTADAVARLNKEDGGNRKYILVQLPEPTDEKSEAHKAGFPTIAHITRERVRRVIAKLKDESSGKLIDPTQGHDLGFKAFKLTASNFKLWNPETAPTDADELAKQLELYVENIQPGKTDEAILYEIILKAGFPLTARIEKRQIGNQDVYLVGNAVSQEALVVCLADPIEEATLRGMLALKPVKMVALDVAFHGNDQLKTNIRLQSEQTGEGDQSRTQFVTV